MTRAGTAALDLRPTLNRSVSAVVRDGFAGYFNPGTTIEAQVVRVGPHFGTTPWTRPVLEVIGGGPRLKTTWVLVPLVVDAPDELLAGKDCLVRALLLADDTFSRSEGRVLLRLGEAIERASTVPPLPQPFQGFDGNSWLPTGLLDMNIENPRGYDVEWFDPPKALPHPVPDHHRVLARLLPFKNTDCVGLATYSARDAGWWGRPIWETYRDEVLQEES